MTSRKPPHNRVDPRQRQAELYSGQQEKPERVEGVTLATLDWEYRRQPQRYDYRRGHLIVGDRVVRVRKGMEMPEVRT